MNFSQQRDQLQKQTNKVSSYNDYVKKYFTKIQINNLESVKGVEIEHLFENITDQSINYDLETFLSNLLFEVSRDYAIDCLETAFRIDEIFGKKIKVWLDSALKCFDNFLIRFLNEVLNEEIPQKDPDKVYESEVYSHLENLGTPYHKIGVPFKEAYNIRNSFTHIQKNKDGIRVPKRYGTKEYNKKRNQAIKYLKEGLVELDKQIPKESYLN